MWIVAIAWMYVALMMTVVEATAPNGTVLGAIITLLLYGIAPLALVMYLLGTPGRRRAKLAAERQALAQAPLPEGAQAPEHKNLPQPSSAAPDQGGLTPSDGLPPK